MYEFAMICFLVYILTCFLGTSIIDIQKEKVLLTSLNYYHIPIYLLQLENTVFVLLELFKLADLFPWMVFQAVLADVALYQLPYMAS